ncbi:adenylosuccinate synthetase [Winogradskyella sp. F6397]|uniref:Adenylosuccinate synthetase n=1 Tax=Winogradskyella marina TaxID=2785530 RepID=A0ABS0EJG8_9FLAO|nr:MULTISPECIES: adenylosuccinate synthetase [Winogradskyella]MBF8150614.1 adenylosuccinate synthetase [Winogradskyella marina]
MLTTYTKLLAQIPSGTPNPGQNSGIDFSSPFDVIVFIVLPILLIISYFVWRKKK